MMTKFCDMICNVPWCLPKKVDDAESLEVMFVRQVICFFGRFQLVFEIITKVDYIIDTSTGEPHVVLFAPMHSIKS